MVGKRGGQINNQNARTHGFYSNVLRDSLKRDLERAVEVEGLDEEIAVLRIKIKDLLEHDPDNMKLIGQALKILAGLISAKHETRGQDIGALEQAFENVFKDFGGPQPLDIARGENRTPGAQA